MPKLLVGSKAPPFKVGKWFKGEPIDELKPGNIYVVEFWATWCGPCIALMPHLTELAKKYEGQATFVGISVSERPPDKTDEAIFKLVENFLAERGSRIRYAIAADGTAAHMATSWYRASGQFSIPCSMIVGRDGRIAWIGMAADLERPLAEIIAGTFDVNRAAELKRKSWEVRKQSAPLSEAIFAARQAKDGKAILEAIDKIEALTPSTDGHEDLYQYKFFGLLLTDEPAAFAFLEKIGKDIRYLGDVRNLVTMYGATIECADSLKDPHWNRWAEILNSGSEIAQHDSLTLTAAADAFARAGKLDSAIEIQKQAVQAATRQQLPAAVERYQKKLEEFETLRGK